MTWNRALTLVLSLSLALTLGLLYRARSDVSAPGPDYAAFVSRAREREARLDQAKSEHRHREQDFVDIVARLKPSVVSIFSTSADMPATGTGVIVDRAGHVLTNLHVVSGLDRVAVMLCSRETYAARVVGSDEPTDLAVLQIECGEDLLPITFGDSDEVEVGEEVLAIGNAYGFGWSVSHGIVSSLHRSTFRDKDNEAYTDYIQTDAAINPGNSGGPLVDRFGRVIGICSVIVSESGASAGLGFALPARDASFVAQELIARGAVQRGYVGIRGLDLAIIPRSDRKKLGADTAEGVMVRFIEPNSPAEAARFQIGDIILALGGERIADMQALRSRVARLPVGKEVAFTVIRDKVELTVVAVAGRKPERLPRVP